MISQTNPDPPKDKTINRLLAHRLGAESHLRQKGIPYRRSGAGLVVGQSPIVARLDFRSDESSPPLFCRGTVRSVLSGGSVDYSRIAGEIASTLGLSLSLWHRDGVSQLIAQSEFALERADWSVLVHLVSAFLRFLQEWSTQFPSPSISE